MPRYRLLLLELLKHTQATDPSYPAVSAAAEKISSITHHIDQLALRYENGLKAFKRISGAAVCRFSSKHIFFSLLIFETKMQHLPFKKQLFKEGSVITEDRKKLHIFLFEDILLEAKPISKKEMRKVTEKEKDPTG